MKILVTGSSGFIGKNIISEMKNRKIDFLSYDRNSNETDLEKKIEICDFVIHLAGVNRPLKEDDFIEGNVDSTAQLVKLLEKHDKKVPVLLSSSIQVVKNNPYGESKKAAEQIIIEYGNKNNVPVYIYRLPNVFGKWSKPNYNSVVATFCHNVSRGLPLVVNDENAEVEFVYIDDVVDAFLNNIKKNSNERYFYITKSYTIKIGALKEKIENFEKTRQTHYVPDMSNEFTSRLWATYLSYLPEDSFSYKLKSHSDDRGSFTEIFKSSQGGQVSVNISKAGIVKGNHWHHTKNEKFLVVHGKGVIRFRKIGTEDIIEYFVSDSEMEVVDIPVGYTHNIENLGDSDMVTIMWASEVFDPEKPDTFFEEV